MKKLLVLILLAGCDSVAPRPHCDGEETPCCLRTVWIGYGCAQYSCETDFMCAKRQGRAGIDAGASRDSSVAETILAENCE